MKLYYNIQYDRLGENISKVLIFINLKTHKTLVIHLNSIQTNNRLTFNRGFESTCWQILKNSTRQQSLKYIFTFCLLLKLIILLLMLRITVYRYIYLTDNGVTFTLFHWKERDRESTKAILLMTVTPSISYLTVVYFRLTLTRVFIL